MMGGRDAFFDLRVGECRFTFGRRWLAIVGLLLSNFSFGINLCWGLVALYLDPSSLSLGGIMWLVAASISASVVLSAALQEFTFLYKNSFVPCLCSLACALVAGGCAIGSGWVRCYGLYLLLYGISCCGGTGPILTLSVNCVRKWYPVKKESPVCSNPALFAVPVCGLACGGVAFSLLISFLFDPHQSRASMSPWYVWDINRSRLAMGITGAVLLVSSIAAAVLTQNPPQVPPELPDKSQIQGDRGPNTRDLQNPHVCPRTPKIRSIALWFSQLSPALASIAPLCSFSHFMIQRNVRGVSALVVSAVSLLIYSLGTAVWHIPCSVPDSRAHHALRLVVCLLAGVFALIYPLTTSSAAFFTCITAAHAFCISSAGILSQAACHDLVYSDDYDEDPDFDFDKSTSATPARSSIPPTPVQPQTITSSTTSTIISSSELCEECQRRQRWLSGLGSTAVATAAVISACLVSSTLELRHVFMIVGGVAIIVGVPASLVLAHCNPVSFCHLKRYSTQQAQTVPPPSEFVEIDLK